LIGIKDLLAESKLSDLRHKPYLKIDWSCGAPGMIVFSLLPRGGGLGSRPKKMYGERLGDGVEYHLMKPTPRR